MLSFFSSRPNWDSPIPLHAGECVLPHFGPGGRAHSLAGEGVGGVPIPTRGHNCCTGTLDVRYMYFVVLVLNYWIWSLDIQDSMFVELES